MANAKIADSTTVAIDSLQLWDRNPRSIKGERFNELKARLKRQGQIKPLLVAKDGTTVIGGNMRLRAMKELGIEEVWISQTEAQTDKEIFDLALTDNEEFGYYEQEQVAELALELGLSPLELKSYALSLAVPTTLDLVLDKFGPEDEEDEAPEVDDVNPPSSQLGEIYQLGNHRLMCGSSTDIAQVQALLNGADVDMIFTDPPYNAAFNGRSGNHEVIMNDELTDNEFNDFLQEFIRTMYAVAPLAPKYICTDWKMYPLLYSLMEKPAACIVWVKNMFGMGNGYRHQHELIIFEGSLDANDQSDVWEIKRDSGADYDHPTQKPIALPSKAIKNSSRKGGIVLDMFGGSGPTLLAAERLDRVAYLMELDPKYCDVIRKRYAKHIGEEESWQEATPSVNQPVPA